MLQRRSPWCPWPAGSLCSPLLLGAGPWAGHTTVRTRRQEACPALLLGERGSSPALWPGSLGLAAAALVLLRQSLGRTDLGLGWGALRWRCCRCPNVGAGGPCGAGLGSMGSTPPTAMAADWMEPLGTLLQRRSTRCAAAPAQRSQYMLTLGGPAPALRPAVPPAPGDLADGDLPACGWAALRSIPSVPW
ncbi:hypothetical protein KIL84_011241 [Mauremys mutica]|uniref:Uncharacterized protein n=1 Tax=Mauremys mutica TaxID=74926 RepID=A0A9D4B1S7_9SAUR|nr:hypothetical protein KIL84_011241 [Mauremys mutica]